VEEWDTDRQNAESRLYILSKDGHLPGQYQEDPREMQDREKASHASRGHWQWHT